MERLCTDMMPPARPGRPRAPRAGLVAQPLSPRQDKKAHLIRADLLRQERREQLEETQEAHRTQKLEASQSQQGEWHIGDSVYAQYARACRSPPNPYFTHLPVRFNVSTFACVAQKMGSPTLRVSAVFATGAQWLSGRMGTVNAERFR